MQVKVLEAGSLRSGTQTHTYILAIRNLDFSAHLGESRIVCTNPGKDFIGRSRKSWQSGKHASIYLRESGKKVLLTAFHRASNLMSTCLYKHSPFSSQQNGPSLSPWLASFQASLPFLIHLSQSVTFLLQAHPSQLATKATGDEEEVQESLGASWVAGG